MADTSSEFTANEIKAGALVLAAIAILVGFIVVTRGCSLQQHRFHVLYANFENVGGLAAGAPVRFGGVEVGKVTAVELDPGNRFQIRVTATVEEDVPVNEGSVASIEQISLTSEQHLEISVGDSAKKLLPDGAKVPSKGVASGLFDVPDVDGVIARLEKLLDDVDTLLGVDRARREQAAGGAELVDLAQLAASVEGALRATTEAVGSLQTFIGDESGGAHEMVDKLITLENAASDLLAEMQDAIAENRKPLGEVVDNLVRLTGTASARLDELAAVLARGLGSLADTSADTADLIESQRPTIEETLANLERASRNLRELSRTLADNPAALIRGVDPPGRVSGDR